MFNKGVLMNAAGMSVVNGFLFSIGAVIGVFVMRTLFHIGLCS